MLKFIDLEHIIKPILISVPVQKRDATTAWNMDTQLSRRKRHLLIGRCLLKFFSYFISNSEQLPGEQDS